MAKLAEYIAHREQREAQVIAALSAASAPLLPSEIVAKLYVGTAPSLLGSAERNIVLHLRKLEHDGRVAVATDRWRLIDAPLRP
jgi:hypothetical protein